MAQIPDSLSPTREAQMPPASVSSSPVYCRHLRSDPVDGSTGLCLSLSVSLPFPQNDNRSVLFKTRWFSSHFSLHAFLYPAGPTLSCKVIHIKDITNPAPYNCAIAEFPLTLWLGNTLREGQTYIHLVIVLVPLQRFGLQVTGCPDSTPIRKTFLSHLKETLKGKCLWGWLIWQLRNVTNNDLAVGALWWWVIDGRRS